MYFDIFGIVLMFFFILQLIIRGSPTGDIIEIKQEEIDIWSAVAADVTVGK